MIKSNFLLLIFSLCLFNAWSHKGGHHHSDNSGLKTWTLMDGSSFKGHFSFSKNEIVVIENDQHELIETPLDNFIQEDQNILREKINAVEKLNQPKKEEIKSIAVTINRDSSSEQSNFGLSYIFLLAGLVVFALFLLFRIRKQSRVARVTLIAGLGLFLTLYACNRKGCTDPLAENYNEKSKKDDGSCTYLFNYSDQPSANDISTMTAAFAPYSNHVSTSNDGTWFLVSSDGLVDDADIMAGITAWIAQFPTLQRSQGNNSWKIPITPTYSTQGYTIEEHFKRQAIGLAANGIAIFNPYNATQLISKEIGELDQYGGHSGTADDYHYHAAPLHLDNSSSPTIIAYMLDGFPVYGALEPDGSSMQDLDPVYHGHEINGAFHYHGTESFPYLVKTFRGTVTSNDLSDAPFDEITPQPTATNFRGDPFPMFMASLPHHIDSLVKNGTNTGGTLYVSYGNSLENQKKCTYWWIAGTAQDSLYFNFYDQFGALESAQAYSRSY